MGLLNSFTIPVAPRAKDFRQRDVFPHELPSIMRRHILTGALAGVYGTLTSGLFLVGFGEILGVSVFQWGLLNGVMSLALGFQLVSAHWAARLGHRKLLWWAAESGSRLVRAASLALAFLFFLYGHSEAGASTLVLLMCVSSLLSAAAAPPWFSWFTDIIPERMHGSFLGRRDVWIGGLIIGVCVPAGYLIDLAPPDMKMHILTALALGGVAFGLVDLTLHRAIPEPPIAPDLEVTFRERVMIPLRDRSFWPWLLFNGFWSFAMMLGALANVYFVKDLGMGRNFFGGALVLVGVPFLASALTSKWAGVLVDRCGVRRMLILSYLAWAVLPLLWIAATPQTALIWLSVSAAIGGAATSPAVNAANKLITRVPPPHLRAMYFAVSVCLASVAGGLSPLAGGWFLQALGERHWAIGNMEFVPFQLLFLITFLLRIGSWGLLFRVKSPEFDRVRVVEAVRIAA